MSSRPKLLVLIDRCPYPANDGVAYPIANHLDGLKQDWDIDLLLVNRPPAVKKSLAAFEKWGFPFGNIAHASPPTKGKISRLLGECFSGIPFGHHVVTSDAELRDLLGGREYDAVYVAPLVLTLWADAIARILPQRPILALNLNDSLSEKYRRFLDVARISKLAVKSRLLHGLLSPRVLFTPRLERKMLGLFDLVFVQTPVDRNALISTCGESFAEKLVLAPNGIKEVLLTLPYQASAKKRLIHVGGLVDDRRDLLFWFVEQVFVQVHRQLPDVTLHLAGSISQQDRTYLESIEGITVHGFVDKLEDILQTGTMSIAPMFMRNGLINKTLDSMAAGIPCSGIKAFNGITGFENGKHGFEVSTAQEWQDLLIDVLQKPQLLEEVSTAGRELVTENCRWQTTLNDINERMQSMVHSLQNG